MAPACSSSAVAATPAGWEVLRYQLIPTGSATGLTSEGIYRKSGQNSKTTSLLEMLRRDARSVRLKEGEHQVDDVANTLKRFFRDLGDGLFTGRWGQDWLRATGEPWGGCWEMVGGGGRAPRICLQPPLSSPLGYVVGGTHLGPTCSGGSSGGWGAECILADPMQPCAPARLELRQGRAPTPPHPSLLDPAPKYQRRMHPAAKQP